MKNLLFILISILLISCEKEEVIKDNGYIHFSSINDNGNVGYLICFTYKTEYLLNDHHLILENNDWLIFNKSFFNLNLDKLSNTYDYPPTHEYDIIYKMSIHKNNQTKDIIINPDYFNNPSNYIDDDFKILFDLCLSLIYRK